ncbi:MAG: hypothetical protein PHH71_00590 [Clostridia bacterium]|jgi:nitrate reductase gamma subunit|nr:hypothetical protein [Clostridia bacterium]MDD3232441.1 hypothetical protein [Clostridia bacterium]MDD3862815.1 hypothetical protein [Clostridia bacterium]MDD4408385.1 hypothetical protein [Clostridia bacterium]
MGYLNFVEFVLWLAQTNFLWGVILSSVGFAFIFISQKFGQVFSNGDESSQRNLNIVSKTIGTVLVCIALLMMIFL